MAALFLYLAITIVGFFIGSTCRKKQIALLWTGKVQTITVIALLFVMGTRIGSNEEIVKSLGSIGVIAFVFTVIVMAFSIIAISVGRRILGFDKYGIKKVDKKESTKNICENREEIGEAQAESGGGNLMTLYICISVAVGIVAGRFVMPMPFIDISGDLLTVILCILLLFIGVDIGMEGTIGQNFKAAGWRVIVFPFFVIIGTLVGTVLASLILPMSLQDAACVGAGFGWYSLAPIMLTSYSVEVSAISFMHNVMRELTAVIFIPLIAKKVGYIEAFSLPGAASMDVCLPLVEKATSSTIAVYSFINGVVLSVAVPVLVSVFMSI